MGGDTQTGNNGTEVPHIAMQVNKAPAERAFAQYAGSANTLSSVNGQL